jgi:hypothetical protein
LVGISLGYGLDFLLGLWLFVLGMLALEKGMLPCLAIGLLPELFYISRLRCSGVAFEEALKKLEVVFQETKQSPSIVTVEASTMTNKNMVNSPSNTLGDFEKNTRVISSNIMRKMGYDGQGLGKEGKGILIPIVAQ